MVGSSSLRSRTHRQPCAHAGVLPPRPCSAVPFTFDFFFPARLRPRLLPYFGLFCLLGFFAVTFLARNPARKEEGEWFNIDLGFSPLT